MSNEQIRDGSFPRPESDYLPPRRDDYSLVRRFTYGDLRKDRDHLRTLAIFYYVAAGLFAVFGLLPGFHVALGVAMVSGTMGPPPPSGSGPPPAVGFIFIGVGSSIILFAQIFAFCLVLAGRALAKQKRYIFCFVIAVLLCLNGLPFLILGIFSIIVLARESVKELFKHGEAAFDLDDEN
jgi:hypothetical protein